MGDACLDAAGGYCDHPKFGWHIQFPDWVRALTLRHFHILVREGTEDKLITINVLEFLTEIINYAAMTEFLQQNPGFARHSFPTLLNWTDNMTARSWVRKAALMSLIAKSLQRILCAMMINNPLGLWADWLEGRKNITADNISRMY